MGLAENKADSDLFKVMRRRFKSAPHLLRGFLQQLCRQTKDAAAVGFYRQLNSQPLEHGQHRFQHRFKRFIQQDRVLH